MREKKNHLIRNANDGSSRKTRRKTHRIRGKAAKPGMEPRNQKQTQQRKSACEHASGKATRTRLVLPKEKKPQTKGKTMTRHALSSQQRRSIQFRQEKVLHKASKPRDNKLFYFAKTMSFYKLANNNEVYEELHNKADGARMMVVLNVQRSEDTASVWKRFCGTGPNMEVPKNLKQKGKVAAEAA